MPARIDPPLALLAELTHRCPLRCPYCSNPVELERAARELGGGKLLGERAVTGDPVVLGSVGTLDRDLHVIEPGAFELDRARLVEQGAGGDQRRVQAGVTGRLTQLRQIPAQHRLAAGQREL